MKFIRALVTVGAVALVPAYADDKLNDAMRDLQTGMAGLQQATQDPALLAQLMQDLQVS